MSFRTLLIVKAVVCLVFGVFLLGAPSVLFGILGANLDATGAFPAREYGAALIGALLLTWFGKDVKAPDARGAILLYLLAYDAIGVVITVHAAATGVLNVLAWSIVVVYAFFAVFSAYLLAKEKPFRKVQAQGAA